MIGINKEIRVTYILTNEKLQSKVCEYDPEDRIRKRCFANFPLFCNFMAKYRKKLLNKTIL